MVMGDDHPYMAQVGMRPATRHLRPVGSNRPIRLVTGVARASVRSEEGGRMGAEIVGPGEERKR